MRYRSAIAKHLHGEFKDMFEAGAITAAELREFERDCFKDTPDASPVRAASPQARTVRRPAMAAASPKPHGSPLAR